MTKSMTCIAVSRITAMRYLQASDLDVVTGFSMATRRSSRATSNLMERKAKHRFAAPLTVLGMEGESQFNRSGRWADQESRSHSTRRIVRSASVMSSFSVYTRGSILPNIEVNPQRDTKVESSGCLAGRLVEVASVSTVGRGTS